MHYPGQLEAECGGPPDHRMSTMAKATIATASSGKAITLHQVRSEGRQLLQCVARHRPHSSGITRSSIPVR